MLRISTASQHLELSKTAERVNNPEKAQNQWQRQLNVNRALAIKNFTSNNQNVIANTPILFVAKEEFVQFEGRKMYIDMHWLERVGAENTAMSAMTWSIIAPFGSSTVSTAFEGVREALAE